MSTEGSRKGWEYYIKKVALDDTELSDLEASLLMDYQKGEFEISSLPDIAIRLSQAINQDDASINDIAKIILNDPVFSVKLIQHANSATYAGLPPVKTIAEAVTRLGLRAAKELAMAYAASQIFKEPPQKIKQLVGQLYQHSQFIAVLCYFFAKNYTKLQPESALLGGLVREIGVIPILHSIEKDDAIALDSITLNDISDKMKCVISAMVLNQWGFDDEVIHVAEEIIDYSRHGDDKANYFDLIIAAHWCEQKFTNVDKADNTILPEIGEMPAFRKLGIASLSTEEFKTLVQQAQQTTESLKHMLG